MEEKFGFKLGERVVYYECDEGIVTGFSEKYVEVEKYGDRGKVYFDPKNLWHGTWEQFIKRNQNVSI